MMSLLLIECDTYPKFPKHNCVYNAGHYCKHEPRGYSAFLRSLSETRTDSINEDS